MQALTKTPCYKTFGIPSEISCQAKKKKGKETDQNIANSHTKWNKLFYLHHHGNAAYGLSSPLIRF